MALQKGFLHRKLDFSEIPIERKFMGPFVGLLFAFSFYAFLYVLRDICRAMTSDPPELFWNLSPEELNFYNLVFAAIASFLGQTVCIGIWFDRNQRSAGSSRLSFIQFLHDHRYLHWFFLAGLLKLALTYWVLFGLTFKGSHYTFSLYPDYAYLFYLIILVIFLHGWMGFRRLFPQHSFKWISVSATTIAVLSLGLSRIDFIDQEAFRKTVQHNSVYYKYDFSLPQATHYEPVYREYLGLKLMVVRDLTKENLHVKIFIENEEVEIENIKRQVSEFRAGFHQVERGLAFVQLYVDKDIEIKHVEKLKRKLAEAGIDKIYYMVLPADAEYDPRYYVHSSVPERLPHYFPHVIATDSLYLSQFKEAPPWHGETPKKVQLRLDSDKFSEAHLTEILKKHLREKPGALIHYRYNPEDTFQKYIRMLSAAHMAVRELREEFAIKNFGKSFENLEREAQQEIKHKFDLAFGALPKKQEP